MMQRIGCQNIPIAYAFSRVPSGKLLPSQYPPYPDAAMAPGGFPGHHSGGCGTSGSGSAAAGAAVNIAAAAMTVNALVRALYPHMRWDTSPR